MPAKAGLALIRTASRQRCGMQVTHLLLIMRLKGNHAAIAR